jgi:hypothetical protein
MGILKHLLFWPVTGPSFLARFSLEKVQGVVRDELTDDTRVKEALLDLQLRLELGEIDDEAYEREEARLMAELRDVRRWREEFGLGTRGGVVKVAGEDAPKADEAPVGGSLPEGATLEVTLGWEEEEGGEGRER